jgi:hypothetical protein
MRIRIISFYTLAVVAGVVTLSWALGAIGSVQGGSYHSDIPIREKLQFGDSKTLIERKVILIPSEYGRLVQIVPTKSAMNLFFQNDQEIIRNVILSTEDLWIIQRAGDMAQDKSEK